MIEKARMVLRQTVGEVKSTPGLIWPSKDAEGYKNDGMLLYGPKE